MRFNDENTPKKSMETDNMASREMIKSRTILLTGEVNKELSERVARQLILMENEDKDKPIKVFIDSPGGDADAGYAIFDMLRFVNPPIYTIGMGLVASAGALILLAAKKENRLGFLNSHYMIHQPLSGIRGVATAIEIYAKEVEKLRIRINQLISEETGHSLEDVSLDTDRDFWMGAEEAIDYGLISRIITRRKDFDI